MTHAVSETLRERFCGALARRFGLCFEHTRHAALSEILQRRAAASGLSTESYLEQLERDLLQAAPLRELTEDLTVGETYFFRHAEQFRALAEVALPQRLAAKAATGELQVLSAACASGEEPYSIAILLRERGLDLRRKVSIRAVDVNPSLLECAVRARYGEWSFRETPLDVKRRWFMPEGDRFALRPDVQSAVDFQECNLAQEDARLWPAGFYDIVFCRNLIMYLTPEAAAALVSRISRALSPGGYLFLGYAETLRGVSQDFNLCHSHGTFYYQNKGGAGVRIAPARRELSSTQREEAPRADPPWEQTWVETVARVGARIQVLAATPPRVGSSGSDAAGLAAAPVDFQAVLELLEQERFADALRALHEPRFGAAPQADVLVLRAVLFAQSGQWTAAASTCGRLLELDPLHSGAHYVLGLCREGAADCRGAVDEHEIAAHLDPSFSMPRLHLGLLARRAGEREIALQAFARALELLESEDSSRLVLFGGGFRREALVALCRAELSAVGRGA